MPDRSRLCSTRLGSNSSKRPCSTGSPGSPTGSWTMGREKEAKAYGQALGVLVSRADGASADLADALRWRLNRDEPAAERAGLTSEERALLSGPPVASLENQGARPDLRRPR